MTKAIRKKLAELRKQERSHVRMVRWYLRDGNYPAAAQALTWAQRAAAYRDGIEVGTRGGEP